MLTFAAASDGSCAALDVGVASPFACGAGDDCLEGMARRKLRQARPWLDEAAAEQLTYLPVPFNCFGRAHPVTVDVVTRLARRAARRRGLRSHGLLLRRAWARMGVEVWRRTVAIVRACLPAGEEALGLLDELRGPGPATRPGAAAGGACDLHACMWGEKSVV